MKSGVIFGEIYSLSSIEMYFVLILDKNSEAFEFLERANDKCNLVCRVYLRYVLPIVAISFIGMGIVSLLFSFILFGGYNEEFLYLPYNFV